MRDRLPLMLSLLALVVALGAALRPHSAEPLAAEVEAESELAYHMAYLQRYADKLYFAGAAGNAPLADFYLHEIEETAAVIVAEAPVEDGVEIAPLVESVLVPAVERVEAAVEAGPEAFGEAYGGLVAACNACHETAEHGFIVIAAPERPAYTGQAYAGQAYTPE